MNESGTDFNKIIIDLVMRHEAKILQSLKEVVLDSYKKADVKFSSAFKEYLFRAFNKYSKVKTILYRNEPKFFYDFYVWNELMQGNTIIDSASISSLVQRNEFSVIQGSGGTGKSMLMRHFSSMLLKKNLLYLFLLNYVINMMTNHYLISYTPV